MNKLKLILILLSFAVITLNAQTSEFRRNFSTTSGSPLTGYTNYIFLVPQANNYPTGALALTEDGTRDGVYYRANVPDGEYKIYIDVDKEGANTPTLYIEHYWIGEKRLSTIADHFDAADSYKLKGTGIKDGAVTETKLGGGAVTESKLGTGSVTEAKLGAGAVTNTKLENNSVTTDKIATDAVESTDIKDANITFPKLSQVVVDYIDASGGGTITNNPDDVSLETKAGNVIGVKQSWVEAQRDTTGGIIADSLSKLTNQTKQNEALNLNGSIRFKNKNGIRPIVTFVVDGLDSAIYGSWRDQFHPRNLPYGVAITQAMFERPISITYNQMLQMQNSENVEFLSHGATPIYESYNSGMTDSLLRVRFDSVASFADYYGFNIKNKVHPMGVNDSLNRRICRDYYRSARAIVKGINVPPIETYSLLSVSMSATDTTIWYEWLQNAINQNGWIYFYTHLEAEANGWYENRATAYPKLGRFLDYIQSQGVDVLTVDSALNIFSNVIDVGDNNFDASANLRTNLYDTEFFKVGADGSVLFKDGFVRQRILLPNTHNNSALVTEYPDSLISIQYAEIGAGSFPVTGTLITNRLLYVDGLGNTLHYQLLYRFGSPDIYFRSVNGDDSWDSWTQLTNEFRDVSIATNTIHNDSLITKYPENQLSVYWADDSKGFPEGGWIWTDRRSVVTGYTALQHQLLFDYNSSNMWVRGVKTTGAWDTWFKLNTVSSKEEIVINFNSISANTLLSKNVAPSVLTFSTSDMVVVEPPYNLEAGLLWNAYISGVNLLTFRIYNTTASPIDPISATWKVRIIK